MLSSFAGVSVITGGKYCTTSPVNAVTRSGYHLLVVKDYSRSVRETPNGEEIGSGSFMVGGHRWLIEYCPNGYDPISADFISFYICLCDDDEDDDGAEEVVVEAKFDFSFVDQVEKQNPVSIRAGEAFRFSSKGPSRGCPRFMRRDALERSGYLKGDSFTVRCDIMVCNTDDTRVTISDVIYQHFDYLLESKVGADVTFGVSGKTFAAHRCVLAARSKVFMAQLFGPMTEGTTSSAIQIKDMRAKVFAALLKFIYTDSFPEMDEGNYMEEEEVQEVEDEEEGHEEEEGQDEEEGHEEEEGQDEEEGHEEEEGQDEEEGHEEEEGQDEEEGHEEEEGREDDLTWLQDLLVAADRYDVKRLKFLCENKLSEQIGVYSVASILVIADQHHCHGLKKLCFKFIQTQSPKCLKKVMATDGWKHMIMTYHSVLIELLAKLVSNQKKGKKRKYSTA